MCIRDRHAKAEVKRYEKYDRDPAVRRRYGRAWKRIRDRYIQELSLIHISLADSLQSLADAMTQGEAPEAEPVQKASPPPVSYTHLDVYKRQHLFLLLFLTVEVSLYLSRKVEDNLYRLLFRS